MPYNLKPRKQHDSKPQRSQYVCDDSDTSLYNSSDEEVESVLADKKEANQLSIRNLLKQGVSIKKDCDHIYTKAALRSVADEFVEGPRTQRMLIRKRKSSTDAGYVEWGHSKKARCHSKNAVMARLNREKKKQYISSLENANQKLTDRNCELRSKMEEQNMTLVKLNREVKYLKSLLANSKEISNIVSVIHGATGLPVTSSLLDSGSVKQLHKTSPEHGYGSSEDLDCDKLPPVKKLTMEMQPRTKVVTSGPNFPIALNDVNLGETYMDSVVNPFLDGDFNLASPLLPFEEDLFSGSNFNFDIPSYLESASTSLDDIDADAGMCLHINGKRISVEFCSYCGQKPETPTGV